VQVDLPELLAIDASTVFRAFRVVAVRDEEQRLPSGLEALHVLPRYGTVTTNVLFVALVVVGISFGELGQRRAGLFAALWVAGYVGLRYISFGGTVYGPFLFVPYVALLDVILAGVIFARLDRLS